MTTEFKRQEPDDNIRTYFRSEEVTGKSMDDQPSPEKVEKMIARLRADKVPEGFKTIHEDIVLRQRYIWWVTMISVYQRETGVKAES